MNRRNFLKLSAVTGAASLVPTHPARASAAGHAFVIPATQPSPVTRLPDLEPARWIWYPSGRCLPNTFVLFRRKLTLAAKPRRATGWIAADSRYLLEINGNRIQWGPPPADPRWPEADPLDLTSSLQAGVNVLGATVLFYGQGDGTSPLGKPGFLFWLEIEQSDGTVERICSDNAWRACLARAWTPGHYKRWYLRALQEEFDARLYPHGWSAPTFTPDADWLPAMELTGSPNKPAISTNFNDYQLEMGSGPADATLRPRSIPMLRESQVPVSQLRESLWLEWRRTPREYFECRTPDAFVPVREPCAVPVKSTGGAWKVELDGRRGAVLTFELATQVVGWPGFTIIAPAGTVIELLVHEGHKPGGPALINSHFDSWSRFICREGSNRFETFDFESLRWLQLHIHGSSGTVIISQVGVRRRQFPWPNEPDIRISEPALQRLMDASVNTLHNCAQETLVDGMARERQQYSGDGSHQAHAIHLAFGESRLPARFITTFSQGQTKDGFFLDCWPAYDRLARLIERQLDLTGWGPILDHGVGFNFDCWHYHLYTGDLTALHEPYPRLLRFAAYLRGLIGKDGLLPVEDLGIPSVWIDHNAYQKQRHKRCAFNLYTAAMLQHALAPIATALGDHANAEAASTLGKSIQSAAIRSFWDRRKGVFVNNLPWIAEEKAPRLCDRSLATAILFNQCPGDRTGAAALALANTPPEMGLSYPCNAGWRMWALAKVGRTDVILKDLRERWATMTSVIENNTLQEDWTARHDSGQQWSHCAVAPLYIAYQGLAGIRPLSPGFHRTEIRPQPGDLESLQLTAHTALGPIGFISRGHLGDRELTLTLPPGCNAELVLPREEQVTLQKTHEQSSPALTRYLVGNQQSLTLRLRHT